MADTATRDVYFMGVPMRTTLATAETGGAVSIMEQALPPHFSPPLHVHEREDQVLHVVAGEITARLEPADGAPIEQSVPAGSSIFLPRGVPHTFIAGADGATMLEINTPGGFEQFHIDEGVPATGAGVPEPTEPDIPRLAAALAQYGGEFVGPPMTA